MTKNIIGNNIKNTLFFSSSMILSTLFFLTYLGLKTEYRTTQDKIDALKKSKAKYENNIKSLRRKKDLLIRSIEISASEEYGFTTPEPQPFIVLMNDDQ